MPQATARRRDVIKASAAIASVGVMGALAGCGGGGGDGGDGGSDGGDGGSDGGSGMPLSPGLGAVPSGSTAIMDINVQAFLNDEGLRTILDAAAQSGSDAGSLEEQLDQAQSQQGMDPRKIERLIGFGDSAGSMGANMSVEQDAYGGAVMWSSFTESEIRSGMEDNLEGSITESTYEGTTLYSSEESGYAAFLGGGGFAAGTEQAVKDVVDLANGNGTPVSGEVTSVFNGTQSGPARFAFQFPDIESEMSGSGGAGTMQMSGIATEINWVAGSILYDAGGGNKGLSISLRFANQQAATQTKQMVDAIMQQYRMQLEQSQGESAQQLAAALDKMSTSQSGSTVSLSYEDSVQNFANSVRSGAGTTMGAGM